MATCCKRLLAECRLSIFSLQDTNGKTINVKETLIHEYKFIWFLKCLFVGFAMGSLIVELIQSENLCFYFSFLTRWGILISNVYLLLSWFASFGWIAVTSNENDMEATNWGKLVWGFFATAINSQVSIFLVFWLSLYKGEPIEYHILYGHCFLLLITAIDGYVINRTPIRIKQVFLVYIVAGAYTVWTIIHDSVEDIDGDDDQLNDNTVDDDALYSIINWSRRPKQTLAVNFILFFVVIPVSLALTWSLSVLIPRRYLVEESMDIESADSELLNEKKTLLTSDIDDPFINYASLTPEQFENTFGIHLL